MIFYYVYDLIRYQFGNLLLMSCGIYLGPFWNLGCIKINVFRYICLNVYAMLFVYFSLSEIYRKWNPTLLTMTTHVRPLFRYCCLHWLLVDVVSVVATCWKQVSIVRYECSVPEWYSSICLFAFIFYTLQFIFLYFSICISLYIKIRHWERNYKV